jgi:hypothetical protein
MTLQQQRCNRNGQHCTFHFCLQCHSLAGHHEAHLYIACCIIGQRLSASLQEQAAAAVAVAVTAAATNMQ